MPSQTQICAYFKVVATVELLHWRVLVMTLFLWSYDHYRCFFEEKFQHNQTLILINIIITW